MQKITRFACLTCLSVVLASAPVGLDFQDGSSTAAYAKGGNGGGHGGGGGGGGNGGGKGGGGKGGSQSGQSSKGTGKSSLNSSKSTSNSKRNTTGQSKDPIAATLDSLFGKAKKEKKSDVAKAVTRAERKPAKKAAAATKTASLKREKAKLASKLAGLNSLKRNYHAYMNSSDPRMAALSAFAVAYAQYELANGTEVPPTDPALGDEALRDALLAAANANRVEQYGDGYIDDAVMSWAKDVLGVGSSIGKIDEIRDALAAQQTQETETETTEKTETEETVSDEAKTDVTLTEETNQVSEAQ